MQRSVLPGQRYLYWHLHTYPSMLNSIPRVFLTKTRPRICSSCSYLAHIAKFCGNASNTKADSEGKGLLEMAIHVTPCAICINFAWLWWSPTWSKFQNFSGGAHPTDPPTMLYGIRSQTTALYACRTNHHSVCMTPLLQSGSAPDTGI